jgi:hypothetical protein
LLPADLVPLRALDVKVFANTTLNVSTTAADRALWDVAWEGANSTRASGGDYSKLWSTIWKASEIGMSVFILCLTSFAASNLHWFTRSTLHG